MDDTSTSPPAPAPNLAEPMVKNEQDSNSNEHQPISSVPMAIMTSTGGHVKSVDLMGIPIVALTIDGQERLCLAQISTTLLKPYSYNEIHNRRVALGITCVQCTPVQLEILRRAGAMPVSSRRCGMITKREAERLCKSFLTDNSPPKLPDAFMFDVQHRCAWGSRGKFVPSRYNSSRAKCIQCTHCRMFFSPNKFIFHSHRFSDSTYTQPDAANFNSWRRHLHLTPNVQVSDQESHAWEDVKAMFNGGTRKRLMAASLKFATMPKHRRLDLCTNNSVVAQDNNDTGNLGTTFQQPPEAANQRMMPKAQRKQKSNESNRSNASTGAANTSASELLDVSSPSATTVFAKPPPSSQALQMQHQQQQQQSPPTNWFCTPPQSLHPYALAAAAAAAAINSGRYVGQSASMPMPGMSAPGAWLPYHPFLQQSFGANAAALLASAAATSQSAAQFQANNEMTGINLAMDMTRGRSDMDRATSAMKGSESRIDYARLTKEKLHDMLISEIQARQKLENDMKNIRTNDNI